ncbi:hypothetical protein HYS00_01360 [Candidatus Microgenomates bacterium]|nr:hypothetical protein [Candidatus Microgenomates bacterium]
MKNHPEPSHSNFWLGFVLGAGATGAGLYLFGTQKGRRQLRTALDLTDNIEGTVDDVYHAVVETYDTTRKQAPRVINSEEVSPDDSTIGTMRKVFGVLRLLADKYADRKRTINDAKYN